MRMSVFEKPSTEAAVIAQAVCGAYLMVAFSDGTYEEREKIRMLRGLLVSNVPAGVAKAELEAALPALESAFSADYDGAATRVLQIVASLSGNGIVKRAIMHAARTAVVADNAVHAQEEGALGRLADALGVKPGSL